MKKFTAMLVDDEIGSIKSLEWELQMFKEQVEIVHTDQNPEAALEKLKELKPDILFIDIEMPKMNGFQFVEKAGKIDTHVVFCTAYDQFAVKAFKVSALDYLLKPVNEDELARVLKKISTQENQGGFQKKMDLLMENIKSKEGKFRTIVVPSMEGLEFVKVDTILRCESDSNYTKIFFENEKPILISKTLKSIEEMIENMGFFRVHHSHLINLEYVQKYVRGNAGHIIMHDGSSVPVSRSKKAEFLEIFG